MASVVYNTQNPYVQMVMIVHMYDIQMKILPTLNYADIEDYLNGYLWRKAYPQSLNKAVEDILAISAEDIIRYLSKKAVIEGYSGNLADFADVI